MLECRALAVSYGRHQALKGVDIRVGAGEIVVILGANGAGKTTLLKAIAALVPAQAGSQVLLDGKVISGFPPHRIVESGLALVPEGRGIFGDLTVKENLLLGAFAHRARADEQAHLAQLLALFPKLAQRSAQQARTMSGGEQQMVAIGRALMSAPAILMLDEPSLGLSPLLCAELFKALSAVRKTGVGILLVEQNARQSLAIADRAYLLENGEIVGAGPAAQLANDPAVQAAYLGGAAANVAPTGGGVSAAPRAIEPAAPRAAATMPAWSPGAASARMASTPADALIPVRVADLVRNATALHAAHVVDERHKLSAASGVAQRHPALGAGGTDDLAAALARVSAAAAQTRQVAAEATAAAAKGTAPTQERGTTDRRPLPMIEIYRRPKLEIYRRDRNGTLLRGDGHGSKV